MLSSYLPKTIRGSLKRGLKSLFLGNGSNGLLAPATMEPRNAADLRCR